MPAVSFDSKSLILQSGRAAVRFPIVAATFDMALIEPAEWKASLSQLRHAGFNTVVMRLPWLLHEPTPGRFVFTGPCDVRHAITLAGDAGLKVMLRIGPCVGGGFLAGGLPGWIDGRAREADAAFLGRVTAFWRALAAQFVDLQATRNGGRDGRHTARPVIAVGLEDDWRCLDAICWPPLLCGSDEGCAFLDASDVPSCPLEVSAELSSPPLHLVERNVQL
jgi:hypothetical protein